MGVFRVIINKQFYESFIALLWKIEKDVKILIYIYIFLINHFRKVFIALFLAHLLNFP